MIAIIFLFLPGIYLVCGLLFAVPFILFGAQKIDPHAAGGSWGFRLLIFPGVAAFWPLLLSRWCRGVRNPPEEFNAHRRLARTETDRRP